MKIQDSSFNGLKVTVGTKSVTHARTHALTDAPKAICPINFFKVGGIIIMREDYRTVETALKHCVPSFVRPSHFNAYIVKCFALV